VHSAGVKTSKITAAGVPLRAAQVSGPGSDSGARKEQVAAVCYRMRGSRVELLLIRTRKRRWIFPKGGTIPGLTCSQAAALEAFEEAGVHGRIEQAPFARYVLTKGSRRETPATIRVQVFLCEVTRLETPQELDRDPTWYSIESAERQLKQGRSPENGQQLARVVQCALARIERMQASPGRPIEELQKVKFEAGDISMPDGQAGWSSPMCYIRRVSVGLAVRKSQRSLSPALRGPRLLPAHRPNS